MGTQALVTVDTELTWRHHWAGLGWVDNYARSVEPAAVGLSYQLKQLARYRLKGVFFVDPMPAVLFGIEPIKCMVDTVLMAGQEVQLHIHPMWNEARVTG
jgi:predicted dienelactone hydrolase